MTIAMTDPATLPQWNGRPVPWVTRWTGEVNDDKYKVFRENNRLSIGYEDRNENRDEFGVLWKREGLTRAGEPQYAEVNTYRQRAAMNKRMCQVCGSKIDERPIRWLITQDQLHAHEEGTAITRSAPTCSPCIPLARKLCPHLKKGSMILKVLEYDIWGIYGQAIHIDQESGKTYDLRGFHAAYKNPQLPLPQIAAFQQIAWLRKFVVEEDT